MFSISARLDAALTPDDILAAFGLEKGGRVQRAIDQNVIDFCQPYVPASPDRTLEFSAQVSTEIGSGTVIWNTPYAHYQYMGIVYGPNIPIIDPETGVLMGWFSPPGRPKHPTDRELTYDTSQNPMAGPYWFERMKADRLRDILDAAGRAASPGRK
jgi:hypothetical protein